MCNTSTLYHAACAHYAPTRVQLYCIKALAQAGHSRGCDEVRDLGVENAGGLCPRCLKSGSRSVLSLSLSDVDQERRDSGYASSISSGCSTGSTGHSENKDSPPESVDALPLAPADRGLATATSRRSCSVIPSTQNSTRISSTEAATYARDLLASLPSSIPTVKRNASGVGLVEMETSISNLALPPTSAVTPMGIGLFRTARLESAQCNQHWRAFDGRAFGDQGLSGLAR